MKKVRISFRVALLIVFLSTVLNIALAIWGTDIQFIIGWAVGCLGCAWIGYHTK